MSELVIDFDAQEAPSYEIKITQILGVTAAFLDSLPQDDSLYFNDDHEAMVCLETADDLNNGLREALKEAGFEINTPLAKFSR